MNNDKTFTQRQLPFMLNCNPGKVDPNVQTVQENTSLGLKDVMKSTGINVNVEEAGELTPEAQQEILNEEY